VADRASSRVWRPARWIIALVPLVPIIAALVVGAGSAGAGAPVTQPSALQPAPLSATPKPAGSPTVPGGSGTLVALIEHSASMRSTPNGHVVTRVGPRSDFGGPQALWVREVHGAWLGVVSPEAGNNRLGWVPAKVASLSRVDYRISVSLAARQVVISQSGRVLERYTVAIGKPSTPTPTGRFAVTDRLRTGDPSGPYGCCILALSAHAPHALQGWSGGDRIAIHSTPETSSIGQPVSHGCMRLTLAEGRWLLDHVPLGTPVVISSA
jgi:lipoprotein-anchoring transpeptidase ErfK/SrfK